MYTVHDGYKVKSGLKAESVQLLFHLQVRPVYDWCHLGCTPCVSAFVECFTAFVKGS